jgi:hypothetical protein
MKHAACQRGAAADASRAATLTELHEAPSAIGCVRPSQAPAAAAATEAELKHCMGDASVETPRPLHAP